MGFYRPVQQPEYILNPGTKIRTHESLHTTRGMLIKAEYLDRRRSDVVGTIKGIVPGHGGDIYWVEHADDNGISAYGWMEFELES